MYYTKHSGLDQQGFYIVYIERIARPGEIGALNLLTDSIFFVLVFLVLNIGYLYNEQFSVNPSLNK